MDLWIRSQNKSVLIKCESIHLESSNNDESIFANQSCLIGKYPKERALEVLDEIQNALLNKWANNVIYENCYDNERPRNLVYKMPKE